MKDILITSSFLILAILLVRQIFSKAIPARLQYALWGLVLIRLLLPLSLPAWNFSLLTATATLEEAVSDRAEDLFSTNGIKESGYLPLFLMPQREKAVNYDSGIASGKVIGNALDYDPGIASEYEKDDMSAASPLNAYKKIPNEIRDNWFGNDTYNLTGPTGTDSNDSFYLIEENGKDSAPVSPFHLLFGLQSGNHNKMTKLSYSTHIIWIAGMAVCGLYFLTTNLLFWIKLRRNRTLFQNDTTVWRDSSKSDKWENDNLSRPSGLVNPENDRKHAAAQRRIFDTRRKIYVLPEGIISSPCLFGNAIYLTPRALESETALRHILCHEDTHARHLDPIWSCLKALCLTIYWFNPLVWAAAYLSRVDCELACDESALIRLGEAERILYGETLISLIPVKGTANPFLSSTTMTSGKKQLKKRIVRIARKRKKTVAAILVVVLLCGLVSACTFSKGAAPDKTPSISPADDTGSLDSSDPDGIKENDTSVGQAENDDTETDKALTGQENGGFISLFGEAESAEPVSLSGAELTWFNQNFFNDADGECSIRNQLANPFLLYNDPKSINLFELFYPGLYIAETSDSIDMATDEEIREIFGNTADMLPCPANKISASTIDGCLKKYLGLSLEETDQIGMEEFTYSPKYDAYYLLHGDTNYYGNLAFRCGTKERTEDGTRIRLYQTDGLGWYVVTLVENTDTRPEYGDSEFHFISHQECEKPAIPTVMPDSPSQIISLSSGLEPYTADSVTIENRPSTDFPGGYENRLANWNFDGRLVGAYRGEDGLVRVAEKLEDGSYDIFLMANDAPFDCMSFYSDLFGHDGFYVDFYAPIPHTKESAYEPCRNYYYFDENGEITLLCSLRTNVSGGAFQMDLNGDGSDELMVMGNSTFFFMKDGILYQTEVMQPLLGLSSIKDGYWNADKKCYCMTSADNDTSVTTKHLYEIYFDGENLHVYEVILL